MLIANEYLCPRHDRFELLVERGGAPDSVDCPTCGLPSPWVISAPTVKTQWGYAATRGKSDERPPHCLDTSSLAEGMPLNDWKAKNRRARRDRIRKSARHKFGVT